MLTKRVFENLLWIRQLQIAGKRDTSEIDAKIEALRKELETNPVSKVEK